VVSLERDGRSIPPFALLSKNVKFTPAPTALWSKTPEEGYVRRYHASHRKLPEERQMLCTDLLVPAVAPEKAFVKAWNLMVGHGMRYTASFREMARTGEDELVKYRIIEMARLLQESDRIRGV